MSRKLLLEGRTGDVAIVDDADYGWLREERWHLQICGKGRAYAYRRDDANKTVWMHRAILDTPADKITDHINGDGLDNRRENLRICTPAGNARNRKPIKGRKFKGVRKTRTSFTAVIVANGKNIYLGAYWTEEQAARAYDEAAKRHHGEFARLNFPEVPKAVA